LTKFIFEVVFTSKVVQKPFVLLISFVFNSSYPNGSSNVGDSLQNFTKIHFLKFLFMKYRWRNWNLLR